MTQNSVNSKMVLKQLLTTSSAATTTCSTVLPYDNTIPQNTEGDQILSLAITPISASSTLVIEATVQAADVTNSNLQLALFQDTTVNSLAATAFRLASGHVYVSTLLHKMTSGTTSSTTFKIRAGNDTAGGSDVTNSSAAASRTFGGVCLMWLIIKEYL